jgi:cytochrome c oxidase cbb3-type subunit 2
MYDHPFQWGSKRTGPDLARLGNKYSDEWHRDHMIDPRAVVPASIMPSYPWLAANQLDYQYIGDNLKTNQIVGVPYSDEMIALAKSDLQTQTNPDAQDIAAFEQRYPKAAIRDFDGDPGRITELDALIAYMQMLGTLIDFKLYDEKANLR